MSLRARRGVWLCLSLGVFLLLSVPVAAQAPSGDSLSGSGPLVAPAEFDATNPAERGRALVDLRQLDPADAEALAEALPEWEEPINAGTERITIERWKVDALLERGFPVRVLQDLPDVLPAWPACYHKLDEIYTWLDDYALLHPTLIDVYDIGDSYCKQVGGCTTPGGDVIEGRDIVVARITAENTTSPKEGRFWIDGGLHSREIPGTEMMMQTIQHFVEGYGEDAQITYLLDHRELYIGMASNPDGRLMVELGASPPYDDAPWLWRKNANPDVDPDACNWTPSSRNQYGVDLNRNHAFKFDVDGHSKNPCAATYRGTAEASEPEIQAYEVFLRTLFADQRGEADDDAAPLDTSGIMINFHNATYPGTVLVPWGWTDDPSANETGLWAIGARYSGFNGYRTQHSLYPVSGNTRDWSYGELGIPSYVIELQGSSFISRCSELPEIFRQNLPPLEMMLGLADRPYERVRGPEIAWVRPLPSKVDPANGGEIVARVSELRSGKQTIGAAEVSVGRMGGALAQDTNPHPGLVPGSGVAMQAMDGAFDEQSETVTLDLDNLSLTPGKYYVTIRARDGGGYWGSASAIFFTMAAQAGIEAPPIAFD